MKVVYIGDCHFGASYAFGKPDPITGINSRLIDYEKTLSYIIDYVIDQKIELCIFLGDIFETRNPAAHQMAAFYRQLFRLSNNNITTYIIVGNHDYWKNRQITSSLDPLKELNIPNVSVFNNIDLASFTSSKNETINVLLMPYRNRQSYDKETVSEAVVELDNEIKCAKNKAIKNIPTIVAGHMMMEGTIPNDVGDLGLNELVLPFDMFNGFDLVVNGHIHRPSILNEFPLTIYSGSMECKDFSEKEHEKCFLVYDTHKKGIKSVDFIGLDIRKFIDLDIDYSTNLPDNPTEQIIKFISEKDLNEVVIKLTIKIQETAANLIDMDLIKKALYEKNVSYISDLSITPIIQKHIRNYDVVEATDSVSAFKNYIESQNDVNDDVLQLGISIINAVDSGDKWSQLD